MWRTATPAGPSLETHVEISSVRLRRSHDRDLNHAASSSASSTWQMIGRFATRCRDGRRVAPSHGPVQRVVLGTTTTPLPSTLTQRMVWARLAREMFPVSKEGLRRGGLDGWDKRLRYPIVKH